MIYRIPKGEPLTEGEVEANFKEAIDLVTDVPTLSGGFISNFLITTYYKYDGSISVNTQTGAISGVGTLWAIKDGFNMSNPVEVT